MNFGFVDARHFPFLVPHHRKKAPRRSRPPPAAQPPQWPSRRSPKPPSRPSPSRRVSRSSSSRASTASGTSPRSRRCATARVSTVSEQFLSPRGLEREAEKVPADERIFCSQTGFDFWQLPTSAQVRARILCHVIKNDCSPLCGNERRTGHRCW